MKILKLMAFLFVLSLLAACASTMSETQPTPAPTPQVVKGVICQYAKSATASSENSKGSLAIHATGKPDAPTGGECSKWSGLGFSWTPANWNVKANLVLNYEKPVYVSKVTITGDYDMCWSGVKLRNSLTGEEKKLLNSSSRDCVLKIQLDGTFKADMLVLESCGWAWSATDAVEICGSVN